MTELTNDAPTTCIGNSPTPAKLTWEVVEKAWNFQARLATQLEKEGQVRLAIIGHRSKQRSIALHRIKRIDGVTKDFLSKYFKMIRKGELSNQFPTNFEGFRPTIDWALKKERVEPYIRMKEEAKIARALARQQADSLTLNNCK